MKHKIIYAMALILGLSLFSFNAKAQIWQAYKGIWLNGYENAPQAPLPPVGYSALTYFADSLGTYVYDWDSLAWLRIPGAGGGGGAGLTTADNGLSVNPAGNVQLGGSTVNTLTDIPVLHDGLFDLGEIDISMNGDDALIIQPNLTSLQNFSQVLIGRNDGTASTQYNSASIISNVNSVGGNESTHTLAPTAITSTLTNNTTFSNSITLTSTTFSAQIPTGGFQVDANSATMQNGNSTNAVNFYGLGTSERFRFAAEGSSAGSDLFLNLANPNLVQFQSQDDQIQIGTLGTTYTIDESAETAVLSSSAGSALTANVSAVGQTVLAASADLLILDPANGASARLFLDNSNDIMSWATAGAGEAHIDASIPGIGWFSTNNSLLVGPKVVAQDVSIQTQDGATGINPTGNILLRTGAVTSGTGAVGDIEIRLGVQGGSGSGGNIQIDATSGELIFTITRTDCTGAPSGAIANVAGVLNICP